MFKKRGYLIFLMILIPIFFTFFSYNYSEAETKEDVLTTSKVAVYVTIDNKKEEQVSTTVDKEIDIELDWEKESEDNLVTFEGDAKVTINTTEDIEIISIQSNGFTNELLNSWVSYQLIAGEDVKAFFGPGEENAWTDTSYRVTPQQNNFTIKTIINADKSKAAQVPFTEEGYSDIITITYGAPQYQ